MTRKLIVPPNISAEWRTFGAPRDVTVRFWNYVHADMPDNYENVRKKRDPENGGFAIRKSSKASQARHSGWSSLWTIQHLRTT